MVKRMNGFGAAAFALAIIAGTAATPAAEVQTITGAISPVDADIVLVGQQRVILWGIDAPERSQLCYVGPKKWGCWDAAMSALTDLVAPGTATCTLNSEEPDPFKRRYGTCTVNGKDIAAAMVEQGMARAYTDQTKDYLPQEEIAKAAKIGVWQPGAKVDDPWKWRRTRNPSGYR